MTLKQFLSFVEIKTKLASMLPFIFGTIYTLYAFDNFYIDRFILFFLSLLFIDMSTTAINNYIDFKKSNLQVYKENENVLGVEGLNLKLCKKIIFSMLFIAMVLGFILFLKVNFVLLIIGSVSFFVGITYTFGPTPISRTPYGEIVSSFFMGFLIVFLAIYIHIDNLIYLNFENGFVFLSANVTEIFKILIVSTPFVMCIFNLMLANNICDLQRDVQHNRFLLPYYIGKEKSLALYNFNYYFIYLVISLSVLLKILPLTMIFFLFSIVIVHKNILVFNLKQVKSETFITAVKNLLVISIFYIVSISAGLFL